MPQSRGRIPLGNQKGKQIKITLHPEVLQFLRWYAKRSQMHNPTLSKTIEMLIAEYRWQNYFPDQRPHATWENPNVKF